MNHYLTFTYSSSSHLQWSVVIDEWLLIPLALTCIPSIPITSLLAVWKHPKIMELGRYTFQVVLTVIAPFWLVLWSACSSQVVVAERMSIRSWIGQGSKRPFPHWRSRWQLPPVHEAGRCSHQTIQAGRKNTHKQTHSGSCVHLFVFWNVYYLWVLDTHTHTHTFLL